MGNAGNAFDVCPDVDFIHSPSNGTARFTIHIDFSMRSIDGISRRDSHSHASPSSDLHPVSLACPLNHR